MARTKWLCVAAALLLIGGCGQSAHVVHISSEPSGAVVFQNDKMVGETPLDATVLQRKGEYNLYTFQVVKEDYKPVKKQFKEQLYYQSVADLIPEKLHFVLEARKQFPIYISSEPSGAVVTLNGAVLGETPFTTHIKELIGKPRVFDFVAVKEGYQQGEAVLQEFAPRENGEVFVFPETLHFDFKK